jgi:hypothetical protein
MRRLTLRPKTFFGLVAAHYEEGGGPMVYDAVFAFRTAEDGGASAVYTLALTTPPSKYERDRPRPRRDACGPGFTTGRVRPHNGARVYPVSQHPDPPCPS